jgi:acetolactate synthase-1/2/3 large subunit
MLVADAVAETLAQLGADTVFGLVGSGNFHVTNGLIARGARFVAARHECGAASMADGWARLAGRPGLLSVHQGPGLTNALTGITEAAKARTPLVVLAADVAGAAVRSNFRIDVAALAAAIGAVPERLHSADSAVADTVRAYRTAARQRRTVLLAMPLDVQAAHCDPPAIPKEHVLTLAAPAPDAAAELARALTLAGRPVFIAGRGARVAGARRDLEYLADACGALLATSAAAKGLFRGSPWDLDVSGGFASPVTAQLIQDADLVVAWGCSLNMWTTRHGKLISPGCQVAQVDDDAAAIGAHQPVHLGVFGDVAVTARAAAAALRTQPDQALPQKAPGKEAPAYEAPAPRALGHGYRTEEVRQQLADGGRWRDVPYTDESGDGRIDPRTLSIGLDDLLPAERLVAVDSGNFMGYPSMFLTVPDEQGFCFTQAYQSVGLGLASAIGSAIARPDRLTVAALGDGGALMGVSELETVVRLGLPMVIVVYDDEAYGAEVHHFQPHGGQLDTVRFPPTDIAEIGRGFGFEGVTVRGPDDLAQVSRWLDGPRERPLLIDAKVITRHGSWWLEEAFRGQ